MGLTRAGRRWVASACWVVLVALAVPAAAQTPGTGESPAGPSRTESGVGVVFGVPAGEFNSNVGSAIGLSGHVGRKVSSRVSLGVDASYLWYGRDERKVPASPDTPELTASLATYNNILTVQARVRVQAAGDGVRPYVDGLVGVRDIYTRSVLDLTENLERDYVAEPPTCATSA